MKDRVGDRCGDTRSPQLAHTLPADGAGFVVDLVDEVDGYVGGNIGVPRPAARAGTTRNGAVAIAAGVEFPQRFNDAAF